MALIQVNFMSKALLRTVTVNVILPVDKFSMADQIEREDKPYKTLYLLHGIFGNYTAWVTGTDIVRLAQARDLAVVMPSGENGFYLDQPDQGRNYAAFIGEELVVGHEGGPEDPPDGQHTQSGEEDHQDKADVVDNPLGPLPAGKTAVFHQSSPPWLNIQDLLVAKRITVKMPIRMKSITDTAAA